MKSFKRNTEAEQRTVIPKNTVLPVGITNVQTSIVEVTRGKNAGHMQDKYRIHGRVLAGEYEGMNVSGNVTANVERGVDGSIVPWGNNKKYISFLHALGYEFDDENIPFPEDENELEEVGNGAVGEVVNITFGTFTFKAENGDSVTINTFADFSPLSEEQKTAMADRLSVFKASIALDSGGSAVDALMGEDTPPF